MRAALAALLALAALAVATPAHAAPSPSRWCGTDVATTDRPDADNNAYQVHVIYAYPADGVDNFARDALPIARDLAAIDTWWQAQDSSRTPRFDFATFPGCDTQFGQLDLSEVKLPRPAAAYQDTPGDLNAIAASLNTAPFGFNDPDKKYLVFYDGHIAQTSSDYSVCGLSPTSVLGGGPDAYAVAFLDPPCGDGLGTATYLAGAAAHELMHNLGAVPTPSSGPAPPHACPDSPAHVCDNPNDVMSESGEGGTPLTNLQLDWGRDDYYGHSGPWWDVRNSPFLDHLGQTFALPTGPTGLTATSNGGSVTLTWQPASSPNGAVAYRVWRDGTLLGKSDAMGYSDTQPAGTTVSYAVVAQDALGYLGPVQTLRFTVGLGIVDAAGKLVKDTVPPPAVPGLRVTKTKTGISLRWGAVTDPGGLAGYRVSRNGTRFGALVKGTALAIAKAKSKGTWRVTAVDAAGNVGQASAAVAVR